MPEENEAPSEEGGKKAGLLSKWKGLAGWQKAGVLIAGAGLAIAIAMYFKNQPSDGTAGGTTSGTPLFGSTQAGDGYPGAGDIYPSLPTSTSGGAATVPPVTTGAASPPSGSTHLTSPAPITATPLRPVASTRPAPITATPLRSKQGNQYSSSSSSDITLLQRKLTVAATPLPKHQSGKVPYFPV